MINQKRYKYSEIFGHTIQGEGFYSGRATVWIRFWGCNFECNGFGQIDPLDKNSYDLPYQTIDINSIKKMEDLPVFHTGCDSSYSWSKKFSHLAHTSSSEEICDKLEDFLKSSSNPKGKFLHPKSNQWMHMAFTGGEPMMNQTAIVDIMEEFQRRNNFPKYITIESNGTQEARNNFIDYFSKYSGELFWSISPKLYLSGEDWNDAIKPNIVNKYFQLSNKGQLKYVSNGTDRSWNEVEKATELYRKLGIDWEVWIMPVGADLEGQNKVAATITEGAVERGYNTAARIHTYIFGNIVGK
jgi:organic radical activating enzyme